MPSCQPQGLEDSRRCFSMTRSSSSPFPSECADPTGLDTPVLTATFCRSPSFSCHRFSPQPATFPGDRVNGPLEGMIFRGWNYFPEKTISLFCNSQRTEFVMAHRQLDKAPSGVLIGLLIDWLTVKLLLKLLDGYYSLGNNC